MEVKAFLEDLAERYPSDVDDLENAWKIFQQHRILVVERLAKLGDSQWTRLNIPLGVEAIIREELNGLFEEEMPQETTIRQRKKGSGATRQQKSDPAPTIAESLRLEPPANLDEEWRQLLVDTLPPDRRDMLQKSWEEIEGRDEERYMMFLEYSSYLRKPDIKPEEREKHEQKMEPLLRHYGISRRNERDGNAPLLWLGIGAVVFFGLGLYYYMFGSHTPTYHEEML